MSEVMKDLSRGVITHTHPDGTTRPDGRESRDHQIATSWESQCIITLLTMQPSEHGEVVYTNSPYIRSLSTRYAYIETPRVNQEDNTALTGE
jgi:hypothetical protein